jgi:glycosyltransferase involved in cell wall biosynthesis
MEVSVVISVSDRRMPMFSRSLDTWARQTLPKNDFELVVVDDAVRDDFRESCREAAAAHGLNIQFIRIDKTRSVIPVKTFIPVLTNNVGFRHARGRTVVVTGPETLQQETNLEIAATMASRKECAYGIVYKADCNSTDRIAGGWDTKKNDPFRSLLLIPGVTDECVTKPPHKPGYWYLMAVAKEHVERIGGVDERFLGGLCGEDDDFACRMGKAGVTPVFDHRMAGIHQDHSREDSVDNQHIDRMSEVGRELWKHNYEIYLRTMAGQEYVANKGHIWGNNAVVTLKETF